MLIAGIPLGPRPGEGTDLFNMPVILVSKTNTLCNNVRTETPGP